MRPNVKMTGPQQLAAKPVFCCCGSVSIGMLSRGQLRFMGVSEELCQPLVEDLLVCRTSHACLRQREHYILNEDPNGQVTQIYPQPGRDNFVNAMGVVFLPSQGAFEFDHNPGTEQLLVYVSKKPMPGAMPERVKTMRPDIVHPRRRAGGQLVRR